jgi:YidC/Oxa1 family membrane protein insertase
MEEFEQRNLMIAIVLVFAILIGWQYLLPKPPVPVAPRAATTAPMGALGVAAAGTGELSRAAALAASPRIAIDTARIKGSINLMGARFDDLALVGYVPDKTDLSDPSIPWVILLSPNGADHAYLAQQGWLSSDAGVKLPDEDSRWQAPAGARLTPATPVTLTWDNGAGLRFSRTIAVDANYMFTVTDTVTNASGHAVSLLPFALVKRGGKPPVSATWISYEGPIGGFDNGGSQISYSSISTDAPVTKASDGGWVGFTDKYWLTAVAPRGSFTPINARFSHAGADAGQKYQADWLGQPMTIAPGQTGGGASYLFAGAKEVKLIDGYAMTLGLHHFDTAVDWGWFWFITKPMFYTLDFIYGRVGNFGVAILILTVIVKALFFPLANRAFANMAKMKKLAPEMTKLREQFGDDKMRLQQETMALYKRSGANPVAGCLPLFFQIPVFFSLYKVLYVTIEMRHAPFYGWIHDLSAPDPTSLFNLFGLIPFTPPAVLMIGAWPVIYAITMFIQQKMQPPMPDPVQARIFQMMPIILGYTLSKSPAGLLIYWSWNNLLTMLQQWVINRRLDRAPAPKPG